MLSDIEIIEKTGFIDTKGELELEKNLVHRLGFYFVCTLVLFNISLSIDILVVCAALFR